MRVIKIIISSNIEIFIFNFNILFIYVYDLKNRIYKSMEFSNSGIVRIEKYKRFRRFV